MPLDGTTYHEDELRILDRMSELLASPRRWCKYQPKMQRWWGMLPPAHCLMGAFAVAVAGHDDYHAVMVGASPAVRRVWDALNDSAPPLWDPSSVPAIDFNDLMSTRHPQILALITQTRKKFT